ncbi:unnamed protein product [Dibothriocephalus latus]|uniref:RRM domain-containing protein n=1 Tax=Dibothriocephalus latus TaxID=60516 RepID=A0A3P7MQA5_DIBLA|nr:unnamed protein product [Dibothriocephalus latus]
MTSTAQSVPLPKRQPESQAAPAVSGTSQPVDPLGARKIFVGGLNRQVTSKALRTQFARYGNVTDATVIRDRKTGVSMGYGYVTFELPSVAEAVLAEPKHLVCGSYVGVKKFQKPIRGGINQDIKASATR